MPQQFPLSEAEFRATLDPVSIVQNRKTAGGPQKVEMERMITIAQQRVAEQDSWIKARRDKISSSLSKLDADFEKLGN